MARTGFQICINVSKFLIFKGQFLGKTLTVRIDGHVLFTVDTGATDTTGENRLLLVAHVRLTAQHQDIGVGVLFVVLARIVVALDFGFVLFAVGESEIIRECLNRGTLPYKRNLLVLQQLNATAQPWHLIVIVVVPDFRKTTTVSRSCRPAHVVGGHTFG
jgi:hypothetical protein